MFPLALLNGGGCVSTPLVNVGSWAVTSVFTTIKTDGTNRGMLLNDTFTKITGDSIVGNSALEAGQYSCERTILFNITANNNVSFVGISANQRSIHVKVRCYDDANTFLGYVGFGYSFVGVGQFLFDVYAIRDVGGYSYSAQKSQLGVPSFNAADQFEIKTHTDTKAWSITKVGGNTIDGGNLLGLMPANTSYVKYYVEDFLGGVMTGVTEIDVISIT